MMAIALVAGGGLTVKKACKSRMVLPVSTWHRGRSRRYEGDQRYRAVAILIDRTLVFGKIMPLVPIVIYKTCWDFGHP